MKILKIIVFTLLIFLTIAGAYYGYTNISKISKAPTNSLYIIPQNASVIFATTDYAKLRSELTNSSEIWNIFEADDNISSYFSEMDSIWKNVVLLNKSASNPKIYYSIHYMGNKKHSPLLCFSFANSISDDILNNRLSNYGKYSIRDFKGYNIYSLKINKTKNKYYIINIGGNICISEESTIIERIVLEQAIDSEIKKKNITRMMKISGKGASANIFINYKYFYRLISSVSASKYNNSIKQLSDLTHFTVLDAKINNSQISFNGYSYTHDSIPTRLKTYKNHQAPNISIFENIPNTTTFIYYQGAEKFNNFISDQSKTSYNVQDISAIKKYKADIMTDLSSYFYPWIKSELALCIQNKMDNNDMPQSFAIMDSYDIKESKHSLNKLQKIICDYKKVDIEVDTFRSFEIRHIPLSHIMSIVFGDIFYPIKNTYYTYNDNYIIIANSKETIKNYINNILVKKTLANRESFAEFRESLNNESNIMIYANAHFINNISNPYFSKKTIEYLEKSKFDIKKLGDICIQFIENDNGAFTSLNISTNNVTDIEDNTSWQLALDNDIAAGPFIIKNHKSNSQNILLFDKDNTMYRIDSQGKIAWAVPVEELPIGKPQVVDYYKNGKYQFLYNSKNKMYLYDLNGNTVENYPIALNSTATAPLSLINYDNKKNYRILVPQEDGAVHNYQIDGSVTNGWKLPVMPTLITKAIQYYSIDNKDFILLADTSGNVVFSNRKGEARIETKLAFTNNINTAFFVNNKHLITTDISGRLISIDKKGNIEKVFLRDFSPSHKFFIMDINGDNENNYVYYDKGILYVYSKNDLLFSINTDFELNSTPQSISTILNDSTSMILFNPLSNVFEFANTKGKLTQHEEFIGSKFFLAYRESKTKEYRLISVKGRVVSNYLLK